MVNARLTGRAERGGSVPIGKGAALAGCRHWQGLTAQQVSAATAIGTACAGARVSAGEAPSDPVAFLLLWQRRARATGAACAWLGGQPAGIVWHREGPDAGALVAGQLPIAVHVAGSHGESLTWPVAAIVDSWAYLMVCDADAPNFALWGWCKGFELATAGGRLGKDARTMRDPCELKHVGTRSIETLRVAGKLPRA